MNTRSILVFLTSLLAACNSSSGPCDCLAADVRITRDAATKGPNAFSPPNFTISLASRQSVTWLNRDVTSSGPYGGSPGVTHRLVSDDGTTFTSDNIAPNSTFVATLSAPGTYGYHWSIHPAMTGTLTVNP